MNEYFILILEFTAGDVLAPSFGAIRGQEAAPAESFILVGQASNCTAHHSREKACVTSFVRYLHRHFPEHNEAFHRQTASLSAPGRRTVETSRPIIRERNRKTDSQKQWQGLDLFNNARHLTPDLINLKRPIIRLSPEISTFREALIYLY
jgi:hypothetical protein